MQKMTSEEYRSFLLDRPRTAKLATVRADGRPHVAPIWFDLDGDTLLFTTWHESVKAANLRRDPRVCLCIDEEAPPFSFVQIEGTVTISEDLDDLRRWATRIAGRYMGANQAEAFGRRNGVPGEWLVRVTPTKIVAQKNISD
jgi:PPOX class probable F420-dependent enzyme